MTKCPKCKREIDYLESKYKVEYKSEFRPAHKTKQSYINEKITGSVTDLRYLCPECNQVVFKTHADALEFFK
jgi:hypothetical protein